MEYDDWKIYECDNIRELIDRIKGYFSNLGEIKKYCKFLILKDYVSDIEIISIICWFNFERGVIHFIGKIYIIDQTISEEYYKRVIKELLACAFLNFEYINYEIWKSENYYIFRGEVKPSETTILH